MYDIVPLYRYDGARNDFILLDLTKEHQRDEAVDARVHAQLARRLCDRATAHHGADGLLVLLPPTQPTADVVLRIYNADGSSAEMCGNGARCAIFHWLWASDKSRRRTDTDVVLETAAGLVFGQILEPVDFTKFSLDQAGVATTIRIDVGDPAYTWKAMGFVAQATDRTDLSEASSLNALPYDFEGHELLLYGASLGNPHVVIFETADALLDLTILGPTIARDPHFSRGTNVHLVQVLGRQHLQARHWERGSGLTQACGTGAVAAAVIAIQRGKVISPVQVDVPGGTLRVIWNGASAQLEGPVVANGMLIPAAANELM